MPGLCEVKEIWSAMVAEMACEPLEEWKQIQEAFSLSNVNRMY